MSSMQLSRARGWIKIVPLTSISPANFLIFKLGSYSTLLRGGKKMVSWFALRTVLNQQLTRQISKSSAAFTSVPGPPQHRCLCSMQWSSAEGFKPTRKLRGEDRNLVSSVSRRNYGSIYEPEYLDKTGPETPIYDIIDIQIRGYDFPVLEKFSKYVHKTAERIGLSADEAWATPAKKFRVTKLKPESSVLETEFSLNLYERNVQIVDVPATLLPVFINVVEACIPAGVSLRIHPHLPEHTDLRYVPDLQLKDLRTQLDGMRSERSK